MSYRVSKGPFLTRNNNHPNLKRCLRDDLGSCDLERWALGDFVIDHSIDSDAYSLCKRFESSRETGENLI